MSFAGGGTLAGTGLNAIVKVGLEETTYGTAAAAEMWPGTVTDLVFGREFNVLDSYGINNIRTPNKQLAVSKKYMCTMKGEVDCGVPLAMALGGISGTTDPTLWVFKGLGHTTPSKTYLPSWTIERTFDEATDDSVSLLGAVCRRGSFNIDLDGPFTFDLEFAAKSEATGAATQVTPPSDFYGSWDSAVKVKEGASTYSAGTTIDGLDNIKFSINNNLFERPEFGSSAPASYRQPIQMKAALEMELTRGFCDDDLWDEITDGAVDSYNVTLTNGSNSLAINLQSAYCKSIKTTTNLTGQSNDVAVYSLGDILVAVADGVTYVAHD